MQRQKPATHNIKLKPYQESEHPFGKTVEFDADIRVFGEETAALFAQTEAVRVTTDATKKKRTPLIGNNAEALKKTGQLAAPRLTERWQKKSNTLFRLISAYHRDRTDLKKDLSYREIDAVKYILDPEQREDALQSLVEYAETNDKKKMLRPIIKVGLKHKINLPLDGLFEMMSARDLLQFMQNKAAVSTKKEMSNDTAKAQFKDLSFKTSKLKSSTTKRKTYIAMAAIFPHKEGVKILMEAAEALANDKPAKKRPANNQDSPDLTAAFDDLKQKIADEDKRFDALTAFDEIDEKLHYLDWIAQSKGYETLAALHPNKVTASFYMDRAVEATLLIETPTAKAKRLQELRDKSPDRGKRNAIHTLFVENAPFKILVTDAVTLTEKKAENYGDMVKLSHGAIMKEKDVSLARKTFYQDHRQTLHKATLGWQMKW